MKLVFDEPSRYKQIGVIMTVKELIQELKEIDKKYQDHEVVICDTGDARHYYIDTVDNEPNWDDREEIYINI